MKFKGYLGMMMSLAMIAEASVIKSKENPTEYKPKQKKDFEPIQQKGQFHYWFRSDGTFLSEKQSERMRIEDCVFKCFAINDKNAIKKFNKFNFKRMQS